MLYVRLSMYMRLCFYMWRVLKTIYEFFTLISAVSPDTNDPHRPLFQGQERSDIRPSSLDINSLNDTHVASPTADQRSPEHTTSELLQSQEKYSHGEVDSFPREKSSSQCSDSSLVHSQRNMYTDSDDSKSSFSSKTTDSGCFEKSTK